MANESGGVNTIDLGPLEQRSKEMASIPSTTVDDYRAIDEEIKRIVLMLFEGDHLFNYGAYTNEAWVHSTLNHVEFAFHFSSDASNRWEIYQFHRQGGGRLEQGGIPFPSWNEVISHAIKSRTDEYQRAINWRKERVNHFNNYKVAT